MYLDKKNLLLSKARFLFNFFFHFLEETHFQYYLLHISREESTQAEMVFGQVWEDLDKDVVPKQLQVA